MVASFDLPNATDSQVSGTHAGDDFGLKISNKNSIKGENGTLDSAELNFGITNDQKSGRQNLRKEICFWSAKKSMLEM